MIGFSRFLEEEMLLESLDTPTDFYMTDDTKMPNEIYGAFKIDDQDYGISIIKSKYDKVYILELYRVVNVKKRTWSFKDRKHIRPALSTVIKFLEATYPFIQAKVDGIIIDVPGKTGSERFVSFMSRMLKKSYIKKFREVPIKKTTSKAKNYLFMVRNGVEPTSIFKTATFWKNFSFDHKEDELVDIADLNLDGGGDLEKEFWDAISDLPKLPSDIMDTATEPYKKPKPKVSLERSKLYIFGKTEVELVAGQDLLDQLDALKPPQKDESKEEVNKNVPLPLLKKGLGYAKDSELYLLAKTLDNTSTGFITGFQTSEDFEYGFFRSDFEAGFAKLPEVLQKYLINAGYASEDGTWVLTESFAKTVFERLAFALLENPNQTVLKATMQHYTAMASKVDGYIGKSYKKPEEGLKELDWDYQPKVDDPRIDYLNEARIDDLLGLEGSSYESKKSAKEAMKYLFEENPDVDKFYKDPTSVTSDERYAAMVKYTGSNYSAMNKSMRRVIQEAKNGDGVISEEAFWNGNKEALEFFIEDAPRLTKPMWVIRNLKIPPEMLQSLEPGKDYVDTAIMSTTISPTMRMGFTNGRIKIYLPVGTPIFPALELHSMNSPEFELTLPPASVIRVTKSFQTNIPNRKIFEGIYIGNAAKSIYDRITSKRSIFEEKMKTPEDTYKSTKGESDGYESLSLEDMNFMLDAIKSGKLKLDTEAKKKR